MGQGGEVRGHQAGLIRGHNVSFCEPQVLCEEVIE
jgi:hypothetical protein